MPLNLPMLLVSAPGNRHTIGPRIYAEQEAQAGEVCDILLGASEEQILTRLESGGYRRLGISVALPWQMAGARRLAELARGRAPAVQVLMGGYAVKTAHAESLALEV